MGGQITLQTPSFSSCQPTNFQWSGGSPPYQIALAVQANSSWQYEQTFTPISAMSYSAVPFFPAGSQVMVSIWGSDNNEHDFGPYPVEDSGSHGCYAVAESQNTVVHSNSQKITLENPNVETSQCGDFSISWSGGSHPYSVVFITTPQGNQPTLSWQFDTVKSNDITTRMAFSQGSQFQIYIGPSGNESPVTGVLTVGSGSSSDCLFTGSGVAQPTSGGSGGGSNPIASSNPSNPSSPASSTLGSISQQSSNSNSGVPAQSSAIPGSSVIPPKETSAPSSGASGGASSSSSSGSNGSEGGGGSTLPQVTGSIAHSKTGIITGAIVGSLILILFIALFFVYRRRRRYLPSREDTVPWSHMSSSEATDVTTQRREGEKAGALFGYGIAPRDRLSYNATSPTIEVPLGDRLGNSFSPAAEQNVSGFSPDRKRPSFVLSNTEQPTMTAVDTEELLSPLADSENLRSPDGSRIQRVYHSDGGVVQIQEYPPAYGAVRRD